MKNQDENLEYDLQDILDLLTARGIVISVLIRKVLYLLSCDDFCDTDFSDKS